MDEQDARCHWLLGLVVGYCGDLKQEEQHYLRALALNPNDANVLCTLGGVIASLGRYEEGISHVREAMRRNPYHPDWYWTDLAIVFYMAQRYEDALEAYRHKSNQGYWVQARLAACYAKLGRTDEARAAAAETVRLKPDFAISTLRRNGWTASEVEDLRDGMRKAGLPE
jgi:adenylate cyclase